MLLHFKDKIRYREKLQIGWKILRCKHTNTTSYRTKHCNVIRANIGLLVHVCLEMYIPKFKQKMQTTNLQSQWRSLADSPTLTSTKSAANDEVMALCLTGM